MASSTHRLLLRLSILLGLLFIAATARPGRLFHPCKTLIFFSASSYSLDQNPNPNPNFSIQDKSSASGRPFLTFFFTEVTEIERRPSHEMFFVDRATSIDADSSAVDGVRRDRTGEILSAAGALLFGVGSGALTGAIVYLIWSLFAPNRFDLRDSDDESDSEDYKFESEDDVSARKLGYVAIPADHPPPAKEVV